MSIFIEIYVRYAQPDDDCIFLSFHRPIIIKYIYIKNVENLTIKITNKNKHFYFVVSVAQPTSFRKKQKSKSPNNVHMECPHKLKTHNYFIKQLLKTFFAYEYTLIFINKYQLDCF